MDDYEHLDAVAQAELIQRGEIGPNDLVTAALARIEERNPAVNAVVTSIEPRPPADGPLRGVPFLVKDLGVAVAGVRLTNGSRWLADHVSEQDDALITRYRQAGLVIIGKTNTCEFGLSPTCEPRLFGPTRNPWDLSRSTGGSSGGSAAAVAGGLVALAHGNDLGGSIRYPAAWCGLFGLKPSRGRVPSSGGAPIAAYFSDHVLTRSVRDSAAVLDAVAQGAEPFRADAVTDPAPLRIAVSTTPRGGQAVDPAYVAAVEDAAALLEQLGHHVENGLPDGLTDPSYGPALGTLYAGAGAWLLADWERRIGRPPGPDDLEPMTHAMSAGLGHITAADYLTAVDTMHSVSQRVAAWFDGFDVWLTPTLGAPPPPLGELVGTDADPMAGNRNAGKYLMFDAELANVTGHPAMSVPFATDGDGLPIGIHVLGRFGDEATLFRLAGQLERARPWTDRRPSVPVPGTP